MTRGTRMVLVGIAGVVAGAAMVVAVLALAGSGELTVQLGSDEFRAGRTDAMATAIERDGPIAFGDLVGGERPLYLQHLGTDEDDGWLAIAALAPGASTDCVVEWRPARRVFVDPCSGETYPEDGAGLLRYPTRIEDQFVYIDLRMSASSSTTR